MTKVTALHNFEHDQRRKRGESFEVSQTQAEALKRAGLVRIEATEADPTAAAGAKSSVSPAAQVLPQTTAKPRRAGGKKPKAVPSSP